MKPPVNPSAPRPDRAPSAPVPTAAEDADTGLSAAAVSETVPGSDRSQTGSTPVVIPELAGSDLEGFGIGAPEITGSDTADLDLEGSETAGPGGVGESGPEGSVAAPPDPAEAVDGATAGPEAGSEVGSEVGSEAALPAGDTGAAGASWPGAEAVDRIERRLGELHRLLERQTGHVDSLHAENQRLRAGELQGALTPMIRDVIRVHDDVMRLAGVGAESAPDLHIVARLLVDLLGRWNVEPFEPAIGDPLDSSRHSGVGRVKTSEPISNTVAVVRKCGFVTGEGRVLRAAEVEVYQQEPVDTDTAAADEGVQQS